MLSPTISTKVPQATRQRTYPQPLNENSSSASNLIPDPTSAVSPTSTSGRRSSVLTGIAVQLNLEENKDEIVRYWDRFSRKEIGVIASLKTLGLSSCVYYSLLLVIEVFNDIMYQGLNILLLLIPFAWVSRFLGWSHPTTFARVLIYHSTRSIDSLSISMIQCLSLQLYPWNGYLIMGENRWLAISVKI
jgi:hypothetical protein